VQFSHPAPRLVVLVASRKGLRGLRKASWINLKPGSARCNGSEGDLSRRENCYASYAGTESDSHFIEGRLAVSQCHTRGRVVVVVGGVMSIQGNGNTVYKAKDHSRDASNQE